MSIRIEDHTANAFRIRERRAWEGHDLPAAIEAVAQRTAEIVLAAGPYSVPTMRSLGGWTAVGKRALGPAPDAEANDLGYPTAAAWWRWSTVSARTQDIRLRAQAICNAARTS